MSRTKGKGITFDMAEVTPKVKQRFRALLTPPDANGCQHWLGFNRKYPNQPYVYPQISIDGRPRSARMVAWVIANNESVPPEGVTVSCGNSWCIAPAHMTRAYTDA